MKMVCQIVLLLAFETIVEFKEEVVNIWASVLIFTSQKSEMVSNIYAHGWINISMFVR